MYTSYVMEFRWNEEKNVQLISTRWISFEDIVEMIAWEWLLDVEDSPKQNKYPWQIIFYVEFNWYVYEVPAVDEWDGFYFLKTIYPSRKATKRFTL